MVLLFSSYTIASECTIDHEVIFSDDLDNNIVREVSGRPIGFVIKEGSIFLAFSDENGWLNLEFESITEAVNAICENYGK